MENEIERPKMTTRLIQERRLGRSSLSDGWRMDKPGILGAGFAPGGSDLYNLQSFSEDFERYL